MGAVYPLPFQNFPHIYLITIAPSWESDVRKSGSHWVCWTCGEEKSDGETIMIFEYLRSCHMEEDKGLFSDVPEGKSRSPGFQLQDSNFNCILGFLFISGKQLGSPTGGCSRILNLVWSEYPLFNFISPSREANSREYLCSNSFSPSPNYSC